MIFWVYFFSKNRIYLFFKDYWTTNSCLVERFEHSNPRTLSKIGQKVKRNDENRAILKNLSSSASLRDIFILKKMHLSLFKPTGQQRLSLLTLFNISIHNNFCQKKRTKIA